jgi:MFS family permease
MTSSTMLIIGNVVAGFGTGGLYLLGPHFIRGNSLPLEKRSINGGLLILTCGVTSITAPVVPGVLVDKAAWRWIFYIHIPAQALASLIVVILFKSTPDQNTTAIRRLQRWDRVKKLDLEWKTMFITSLIFLLIVLNGERNKYAWNSLVMVGLLASFICMSLCFKAIQACRKENPIILPKLIRRRSVTASLWLSRYWIIDAHYSELFPFWFQAAKGTSALNSGL